MGGQHWSLAEGNWILEYWLNSYPLRQGLAVGSYEGCDGTSGSIKYITFFDLLSDTQLIKNGCVSLIIYKYIIIRP
jgi:hypothetical protein